MRPSPLDQPATPQGEVDEPTRSRNVSIAIAAIAIAVLAVSVVFFGADAEDPDPLVALPEPLSEPTPSAVALPEKIPDTLRAVESYFADPSAAGLAELFEALGGVHGLEIAAAQGPFDLVTFDPTEPNHLLAAHRDGYGTAENQAQNEDWTVTATGLVQEIWSPDEPHDFIHFNADGTSTVWTHGGGTGFAPRTARTVDSAGNTISQTTEPLYASRFAVDNGTVFALTGEPDWYSPQSTPYRSLVADDGHNQVTLAEGEAFSWIDVPSPGLLVAYPVPGPGLTSVWDSNTLEPLPDHPFAAKPFVRIAVASTADLGLAVTQDGELLSFEPSTGREISVLGEVAIDGVDRPTALSDDGSVAYVAEKTGQVSIWFLPDAEIAASFRAGAAFPRWLRASQAARVVTVFSPDATRMAVPVAATGQTRSWWRIVDLDLDSWISRACAEAGRSLTDLERSALGVQTEVCI